jgi:thiamine transport system substrate-binding protein
MASRLIIVFLCLLGVGLASCRTKPEADLRILTYDSLRADGAIGGVLFAEFQRRCQCRVHVQSAGDAGQIVARFALDKSRKRQLPHVLLGIDQNLFRSVQSDAIEIFDLPSLIAPQTKIDPRFVPFDFGYFSFIADLPAMTSKKLAIPQSYSDLLRAELKSQFILQDPRTSSPGLGFLQSIQGAFGKSSLQFLTQLRGRWLTMPSGWDEAYGLFLKGEAPLVWSYTTSQAYHDSSSESKGRYKALMFKEGQGLQIEGAIAVRSAMSSIHEQKLTKMFFDLLLSPEIQKEIPLRQWMYPARTDVELPLEFKALPTPTKILYSPDFESELAVKQWSEAVLK